MQGQSAGAAALSPLAAWAAQAHEMFTSLVDAGFTGNEALAIVVSLVRDSE